MVDHHERLTLTYGQTISYAATYGIVTEAHLVGQEYSLLITIFYIGYLVSLKEMKFPALHFVAWPNQLFLSR